MPKFKVSSQFLEWQEAAKVIVAKDQDEAQEAMVDLLQNERGAESIIITEVKKIR